MTDKHDEKAREIIIKHTAIVHPEGTTVNFADLAEAIAEDRRQVERETLERARAAIQDIDECHEGETCDLYALAYNAALHHAGEAIRALIESEKVQEGE